MKTKIVKKNIIIIFKDKAGEKVEVEATELKRIKK